MSPLDLHVLGTPPAFVLSQDQTLPFNPFQLIGLLSFFSCVSVSPVSFSRSAASRSRGQLCYHIKSPTPCQALFFFPGNFRWTMGVRRVAEADSFVLGRLFRFHIFLFVRVCIGFGLSVSHQPPVNPQLRAPYSGRFVPACRHSAPVGLRPTIAPPRGDRSSFRFSLFRIGRLSVRPASSHSAGTVPSTAPAPCRCLPNHLFKVL